MTVQVFQSELPPLGEIAPGIERVGVVRGEVNPAQFMPNTGVEVTVAGPPPIRRYFWSERARGYFTGAEPVGCTDCREVDFAEAGTLLADAQEELEQLRQSTNEADQVRAATETAEADQARREQLTALAEATGLDPVKLLASFGLGI